MNYDEKCQLLIIGDSTVGKTSLLYRYTEDKYSSQYLATVGIDFFTKDVFYNGKNVRIKIWDTAGQERYKSLTNSFFRNAQGTILVYDVTSIDSFENLKYWIQSINMHTSDKTDMKMVIVGNKIDLPREVSKEEAEKFANENHVKYFETSAKTGAGIQECMNFLVNDILQVKNGPEKKETGRFTVMTNRESKQEKEKKCKC